MILTRSIRGIERRLEVWWDTLPLTEAATFHAVFVDELPPVELTERELADLQSAADEMLSLAEPVRLFDRLNARPDVLFILFAAPLVSATAWSVWSYLS